MKRQVMWTRLDAPGMEHLTLAVGQDKALADGIVLTVENDSALRLRYRIECDSHWRLRRVEISFSDDSPRLGLTANGDGGWFDESGSAVPRLDGCVDLDITATPFSNTLPIRRLELKPGESADIRVAYVTVPDLQVMPDDQRYTCLERSADGGTYRFEQLSTGFKATLQVDADGLVEEYPELFRRAWKAEARP